MANLIALEYSRFRVWQYMRPSGHSKSSGFLRGTSAPITEWAFALVDEAARPELVYLTAQAKAGFPSAEHAISAARSADWERAGCPAPTEQRCIHCIDGLDICPAHAE